jgi:putative hemin transport protein
MNASTLWQRYQQLKVNAPMLRARDAARQLDVSEAELVAADPQSTMLFPKWADILGELETLGNVMTLTRNEAVVHEKTGVYANVNIDGEIGLALNPEIDLRFFLHSWRYGFAVRSPRSSIQFFDRHGDAVHKIFLTAKSDTAAYAQLVQRYGSTHNLLQVDNREKAIEELTDDAIDGIAFRRAWLEMKDTHEFFPLLRRFKLTRMQALRLAPDDHVQEVDTNLIETLLHSASESGISIMVFAGNHGCLQIHTGPIHKIATVDSWLNVLDPGFSLHIQTGLLERAFIVRKPTTDGAVSSLECYDATGEMVVQFFGERKPGRPELPAWTALLQQIGSEEAREISHA